MPSFSATFLDFVIYIVPGFVVLYSFHRQLSFVGRLFDSIPTNNGYATLITLLILAMAIGVVVAGISSVLIPRLARKVSKKPNEVLSSKQLDYARLYTKPPETLQMWMHHIRIYHSFAHMATALCLSLIAFICDSFTDFNSIDHWWFKFVMLSSFSILMLWAAVQYVGIVYDIGDKLGKSENKIVRTSMSRVVDKPPV